MKWEKAIPSIAVVFGVVLIAAACLKLLDDFWLYRLSHSKLFLLSVVLDSVVGSMLIALPKSRISLTSGAVLFGAYSIYRVLHWSIPCDCLGAYSQFVSDIGMLSIVIVGGLSCCLGLIVHRSTKLMWTPSETLTAVGLLVGCVGFIVLYQTCSRTPRVVGTIENVVLRDKQMGVFDGELRIVNETSRSVKLLGSANTRCAGALAIRNPVDIEPNCEIAVPCSLPGIGRGEFATGSVGVYMEMDGKATAVNLPWICRITSN